MKLIKDKRGQSAFAGIILMAAGLVALVAMFSIAPLIGHSVDTAINIPSDEYASGEYTVSGNLSDGCWINISTERYEIDTEGNVSGSNFRVDISGAGSYAAMAGAIATEVNANSSLVDAINASAVVTITAKTIGAAANSYPTTDNCSSGAFGATTLTGGSDGSDWNAEDNSNVPTGLSIWTSNAPLLALVVTVSILVMVIGAIMTFGSLGRRGKD